MSQLSEDGVVGEEGGGGGGQGERHGGGAEEGAEDVSMRESLELLGKVFLVNSTPLISWNV